MGMMLIQSDIWTIIISTEILKISLQIRYNTANPLTNIATVSIRVMYNTKDHAPVRGVVASSPGLRRKEGGLVHNARILMCMCKFFTERVWLHIT